jgi:hypothetical protein
MRTIHDDYRELKKLKTEVRALGELKHILLRLIALHEKNLSPMKRLLIKLRSIIRYG